MTEEMKKLINKNELRRLQKAARDKDMKKLADWSLQFEQQMAQVYEKAYRQELGASIDNFMIAIAYSLHFSENTKFGKKRLNSFFDDLLTTIDMFRTGEYSPEEYKEQLAKDGIKYFNKKEEKE